jgi:hypothetical protein
MRAASPPFAVVRHRSRHAGFCRKHCATLRHYSPRLLDQNLTTRPSAALGASVDQGASSTSRTGCWRALSELRTIFRWVAGSAPDDREFSRTTPSAVEGIRSTSSRPSSVSRHPTKEVSGRPFDTLNEAVVLATVDSQPQVACGERGRSRAMHCHSSHPPLADAEPALVSLKSRTATRAVFIASARRCGRRASALARRALSFHSPRPRQSAPTERLGACPRHQLGGEMRALDPAPNRRGHRTTGR